jgi:hypothetical protein
VKSYSLILTLMFASVFAAGCRSTDDEASIPEVVPPGSFVENWSVDVDYESVKSFHFVNDLLFVYGPENMISAFDPAGALQFRKRIGTPGDTVLAPMVQPERVIFPTGAVLEVVDRRGIRQKTVDLGRPVRSGGVAVNDLVYLSVDSDTGGRIAAISLTKPFGDPAIWTRLAGGTVRTQPQLFENVIYFATQQGSVVAMTNDPTLLWPPSEQMPSGIFKVDGLIRAQIRVDESGVYVASTDSKLYGLDPITGRIRWEYFAGTPLVNPAQPTADTVYIYVDGKGMVALEKRGAARYQTPRWTNATAKEVLADDAKHVFVLTDAGYIAALDKKTGVEQFRTDRNDFIAVAQHINPNDNTLFAITSDKKLISIRPVTRAGVVGRLVMDVRSVELQPAS